MRPSVRPKSRLARRDDAAGPSPGRRSHAARRLFGRAIGCVALSPKKMRARNTANTKRRVVFMPFEKRSTEESRIIGHLGKLVARVIDREPPVPARASVRRRPDRAATANRKTAGNDRVRPAWDWLPERPARDGHRRSGRGRHPARPAGDCRTVRPPAPPGSRCRPRATRPVRRRGAAARAVRRDGKEPHPTAECAHSVPARRADRDGLRSARNRRSDGNADPRAPG